MPSSGCTTDRPQGATAAQPVAPGLLWPRLPSLFASPLRCPSCAFLLICICRSQSWRGAAACGVCCEFAWSQLRVAPARLRTTRCQPAVGRRGPTERNIPPRRPDSKADLRPHSLPSTGSCLWEADRRESPCERLLLGEFWGQLDAGRAWDPGPWAPGLP